MKDFYALFVEELKSIYEAEKSIVKALPGVIKAAHSSELKEALQTHLKETKEQVKRLDEIALLLNEDLSGGENHVIKSLISECGKIIKSKGDSLIKDSALIKAAQHIEHYEIATYGFLKSCAKHLKAIEIYNLLDDTSEEEGRANKTLTSIAEGNFFHKGVNDLAFKKTA